MRTPTSYLLDEPPLLVIPSLAKLLGDVNAAIVLQQIHYWIEKSRKSKTSIKYGGRYWTYNSVMEWQEQFPWLTAGGVRHVLERLREKKLVLVKHLQLHTSDRRLSYTIDYSALDGLSHLPPTANDLPPGANDLPPTANVLYSETPSETSTENSDGIGKEPQPLKTLKIRKERSSKQLAYDLPLNAFAEAYKRIYGADYVFSSSRDYGIVKDLMRQSSGKNGQFMVEFKSRLDLAERLHKPNNKWEQFPPDLPMLRARWNRLVESKSSGLPESQA